MLLFKFDLKHLLLLTLMFKPKLIFLFICAVVLISHLSAQSISSTVQSFDNHILQLYVDSMKNNLRLYSGSEYVRYGHGLGGNPFFKNSDFTRGAVLYDGVWYKEVPMLYDLVLSEIVIKDYNGDFEIKLLKEKIQAFNLGGHNFIASNSDTTRGNVSSVDFYDKLYEGKVMVLAKYQKEMEMSRRTDEPSKFTEYTQYYIRNGNDYFIINNERDLYAAMHDKKAEIKKYLNKNKLKLKKDMENVLIELAKYYDSLKQ